MRCARDSDWCDGRLCTERGIDCSRADAAQDIAEAELERLRGQTPHRHFPPGPKQLNPKPTASVPARDDPA